MEDSVRHYSTDGGKTEQNAPEGVTVTTKMANLPSPMQYST